MKRKFIFNLNKSTLKAKAVGAKITTFALSDSKTLLSTLLKEAWRISVLSLGKSKGLSSRVRIFNNFMQSVFRIYRNHGASFTIKWLKGNSVALQRFLARSPYHSLREIEPTLPLPRLINGLPGVIPQGDRRLIREDNIGIIRFWLSIFNIYRILDGPLKPKLNSITDPYSGEENIIHEFKWFCFTYLWKILPGIKPSDILTSANFIFRSQKAGPNTSNSLWSYYTDLCWWAQSEEDYNIFKDYCSISKSHGLWGRFDRSITHLFDILQAGGRIPVKGSFAYSSAIRPSASTKIPNLQKGQKGSLGYVSPESLTIPLRGGQLAFKVEAAGKLRVFAIVDIWTQSVLSPLHDSIFNLLSKLPNDGTFDQEASFRRAQVKATTAGKAYSVDLSSATDRLPLIIQANLLDSLTGIDGFGSAWSKLLTKREYYVPNSPDERLMDLKLPFGQSLKYKVGQPMGALSSWGMLALTHHMLVQFAASRCGKLERNSWYDNYEVLGDDIVIFDDDVYNQYVLVMDALGVDTNPSKSIPSPERPVCEFAKRTSVGLNDVSGLSWKELLQGNNLPGKINLVLRLGERLLINNEMILKSILVRFGDALRKPLQNGVSHALIGILGSLLMKIDKKSLSPAISLLVNPDHMEGEDYSPKEVSIPIHQAMQVILRLMSKESFDPDSIISRYEDRLEFAKDEILPFMAQTIYLTAFELVKRTVANYDNKVTLLAATLIDVSEVDDKVLKSIVRSIAEDILLQDEDPQDYLDSLETKVYNAAKYGMPIEEALKLLKDATSFANRFEIQYLRPKGEIPTDNALALMASRAGDPTKPSWYALPEFQGYPELGLHSKDWLAQLIAPSKLVH